jgi:DNA-binding NarL/FixJ family response regulator
MDDKFIQSGCLDHARPAEGFNGFGKNTNPVSGSLLLADDHTVVRHGLRALLGADEGIVIVGEAETGRRALELAKELRPSVVLMDIAMPCLNGLEATRQILRDLPETKVLILSSYTEDDYVRQAMEAGAAGYLAKQIADQELVRAIWEAEGGNATFSPAIAKRLKESSRKNFSAAGCADNKAIRLTSREVEVLQLIAEGYANKQTGAELSISIKTVEKHRQSIMDKLGIHQTAGLTRYAIGKGIIENPARSLNII